MKFRTISMLAFVACLATGLSGQVSLQCTTLAIGQPYTVTLAGGPAGATTYFALDQAVAPYYIASFGITVDLALSAKSYIFPKQMTDVAGGVALNLAMAQDPTQVGQHTYMQAITLDPTSGSGRVSNLIHVGVHSAPTLALPGTNLGLGNDQVMPTAFSFLSFPFYGSSYSSTHVSSNGRITFTGGSPLSGETIANHLADEPSIAVLWDDLDPSAGGSVEYSEDPTGAWARIAWVNVPQFGALDSNSASVTLFATGDITIDYGNIALGDCLTGISPGINASANGPMDFSTNDWRTLHGAIYEHFTANFDLAGSVVTLHPYGAGNYSLTVN